MGPTAVSLAAPAKLNLRLLVGPPRGDGFHPIESLMVAVDGLVDDVTVRRSDIRRVRCAGVAERDNLAWAALDALESEIGRAAPCEVDITKRIPAQAGLGGGSSDAAATLIGANRVHGLGLGRSDLERIAARVGSDVPFFVAGGAQWARGRGELLEPAAVPSFAAVIVKPPVGLATARVYRAFDDLAPPTPAAAEPAPSTFDALATWVRNDLWAAALSCAPQLDDVAAELRASGAAAVMLCGSGSAMAGLHATHEAAASAAERCSNVCAVVRVAPSHET